MRRSIGRIAGFCLLAAAVGGVVYAFMPNPVRTDLAPIERGELVVSVEEDGRTRLKERYVVSSPLAGRLQRITLKEGDTIRAGETVLAVIEPVDPALLDARQQAEARTRVSAAEAALAKADPELARAEAALEFAQRELERRRRAAEGDGATVQEIENAEFVVRQRAEERRAAEFARDIAGYELAVARAALVRTRAEGDDDGRFDVLAPINGRVLRVLQESAGVVAPGAALLEVGDPGELEIEVDVLSADAVSIRPGAPVSIERWGGERALRGVVRLIEPSGFTKVSALGVEEQRVNVIVDFVDPPEQRAALGDGFRVEPRIEVWRGADVVRAPVSALFRSGDGWAVFVVERGRAVVRTVEIGRSNTMEAEVRSGLRTGDTVVLFPSDRIGSGTRVRPRG